MIDFTANIYNDIITVHVSTSDSSQRLAEVIDVSANLFVYFGIFRVCGNYLRKYFLGGAGIFISFSDTHLVLCPCHGSIGSHRCLLAKRAR